MSGEAERSTSSADIVRDTLREYAERGVFRGFDHSRHAGQESGEDGEKGFASSFRFFWLGPRPFHIDVSPDGAILGVRNPLPALARYPAVRSDVERMIDERLDMGEGPLPPHRRIDPETVSLELTTASRPASGPASRPGSDTGARDSTGSGVTDAEASLDLVVTIREGHHEYAVRKVLNLIHEIWVRLQDRHQRYLWEEFQAPME